MTAAHRSRPSTRPSIRRRAGAAVGLAALLATTTAACGSSGGSSPSTADAASATTKAPAATTASTTSTTTAEGGSSAAYASAITDEAVDDRRFTPLQRDIEKRIAGAKLPGAGLLVLHDGKLVEQEAFGSYELDTRVPIASASKWLTGVTIMSVVEDGLIDLDEPISTYLPTATGPAGAITMRQLVSFTSGLEYDEKIPCFSDKATTLAACNEQILKLPLLGKPGTGFRYTGTHLHVAAGVVEAVTHQRFEDVFQERVAKPLGMTGTSFVRVGTPAADGHPNPAGGAVSTLGDYGRFLEMLVHDGVAPDGERIITPESIATMGQDQTGGARFITGSAFRRAAGTKYGIAHWLDVIGDDGQAILESSPGKFGFLPWIDHTNDLAGVYLVVDQREGAEKATPRTSGDYVITGVAQALGLPPVSRR